MHAVKRMTTRTGMVCCVVFTMEGCCSHVYVDSTGIEKQAPK